MAISIVLEGSGASSAAQGPAAHDGSSSEQGTSMLPPIQTTPHTLATSAQASTGSELLSSPVLGGQGPGSASSHDYTSAGEGLSESIHNANTAHAALGNNGRTGAYARSPVLAAIAGNVGRTGSLRGSGGAAARGRAGGSRSGSISTGSGVAHESHVYSPGSGARHGATSGGSASVVVSGPSTSALAMGLPADDGQFKPIYEGSTIDAREFVRITMQSLRDLGFE